MLFLEYGIQTNFTILKKDIPLVLEYLDNSIPIRSTKNIIVDLLKKDNYEDSYKDAMMTIVLQSEILILKGVHEISLLCYTYYLDPFMKMSQLKV